MLEQGALARPRSPTRRSPDLSADDRRLAWRAQNLRAVGDRIEQLLDELHATRRPAHAATWREELLRLVTELYGAGLERVVELARRGRARARRPARSTTSWSPACCSCTACTPSRSTARVEQALGVGAARSSATHGGDVELLDVDEDAGAVHLRLLGSCDGCPSSAVTLRDAVERAIVEAAPEIAIIDVEQPSADGARPPVIGTPVTLDPQAGAALRELSQPGSRRDERRPARSRAAHPRDAPSPPRPGRARRCELCREPIGDEHDHLVDLEHRNLMCACRGCYLLFTPDGAGGGHYQAVPDRYLAFPDLGSRRAQWDALQIPVSVAFFFVNSSSTASPRSTRARPARPSRCSRSTRGTSSSRPTPSWRRCCPTSRRSSCAPTAVPSEAGVLPRADRRVLRARRPAARCCGEASTAGRRRTRRSTRSSPGCAGEGVVSDARRSRCSTRAPSPTRRCRRSCCGCGSPSAAGMPVHAVALRCQVRIEPQRRRYDRRRGGAALVELFGERTQWGDSLRPFLWTHVGDDGHRRSPGATEVDLPITCTYDFEVVGARSTSTRSTTARSRSLLLFSGTVFVAGRRRVRGRRRWRGTRRRRSGCRCAVWREMMDVYFPNSGWLRVSRETLDALTRFKAAHALPTWDQRRRTAAEGSRRGGRVSGERSLRRRPRRRRRGAVRGLRALPVPRVGAEEPAPLAVRRARPAGVRRGRRLGALARCRTECVVDPGSSPPAAPCACAASRCSTGRSRRRRRRPVRAGRRARRRRRPRGCRGTRRSSTRSTCRPCRLLPLGEATHEELVRAARRRGRGSRCGAPTAPSAVGRCAAGSRSTASCASPPSGPTGPARSSRSP